MGTKKSLFQPDHRGKRQVVETHPGMTPVNHHSGDRSHETIMGTGNIARDATKHKNFGVCPVHPASHRVTGTNLGAPAVTMLSAIPDASNPNALDPTKPGKSFVGKAAPNYPGQRNRHGEVGPQNPGEAHRNRNVKDYNPADLGRAILAEALSNSSRDDDVHGWGK